MESEAVLDPVRIMDLVEDLKAMGEIVDGSGTTYKVVMLNGDLFNEAAEVILQLQNQLLNYTSYI